MPMPPGVAGTSVDKPPRTTTSIANRGDAGSENAASKKNADAMRLAQAAICIVTTVRMYRPGVPRIAMPLFTFVTTRRKAFAKRLTASRRTSPRAAVTPATTKGMFDNPDNAVGRCGA